MEDNLIHPSNNDIPSPEKVYLGSGELNLACSTKKTAIILAITAIAFAFLVSRLFVILPYLINVYSKSLLRSLPFIGSAILGIFGGIFEYVRRGEKYKWYATGRDFTISRKNKPSIIIFYKEVVVVDYEPLKFLHFFNQGYRVRVQTTRGEYEFKYAIPKKRSSTSFDNTPFGLLERIVDNLRSMGLDEAIRDNGIKDFNKPSIEDVFSEIVGEQLHRERDKHSKNGGFNL